VISIQFLMNFRHSEEFFANFCKNSWDFGIRTVSGIPAAFGGAVMACVIAVSCVPAFAGVIAVAYVPAVDSVSAAAGVPLVPDVLTVTGFPAFAGVPGVVVFSAVAFVCDVAGDPLLMA
jgi:hypothetical protein